MQAIFRKLLTNWKGFFLAAVKDGCKTARLNDQRIAIDLVWLSSDVVQDEYFADA